MQKWHSTKIDNIFEILKSSKKGLSNKEVASRLKHFGLNAIEVQKKINPLTIFLRQLKSPLIYILIIVAIITFFLGKIIDTWVITIIVLINSLVGFLQELKAENSLEALKKIIELNAKVIRDDEENTILAKNLVPGDIVLLETGVKVPADLRLISVNDLKIDESILTGESVPTSKKMNLLKEKVVVADRLNMAYAGTVVSCGKGIGIVVETGIKTELGKIAKEISQTEEEKTPLLKRMEQFSKYLLWIIITISIIFFLVGILKGFDTLEIFLISVAAAVSMIPEGLPAIITVVLAIGVHRMVKQKTIVRKLDAVETLGAITTIASDKTGTLTHNQMTLEKIFLPPSDTINVTGKGYEPKGKFIKDLIIINPSEKNSLKLFLEIVTLNNDAILIKKDNLWNINGDPTEGGLLTASAKANFHKKILEEKYPRLDEIPFSSEIGFMATINKKKNKNIITTKGALEKILSLSSYYLENNKIKPLTKNLKNKFIKLSDAMAEDAYRTLAIAYKEVSLKQEKVSKKDITKLIFVGFCALSDPVRKDATIAIKKCKTGGIRPIMITGDYAKTAVAIAKKVGIANQKNPLVYTEDELNNLNEKKFNNIVQKCSIFARITPKTKLKIVQALQNTGEIVAVTGDGVNDAPVLKISDIGIAMGQGGTDVAREASDMVLLDNNFATIVNAIEEGRTIFLNIRRAIFYLLSTNTGEIAILLSALFIGFPMPLTALQILWINLITDTFNGIALAMEPKHIDIINSPPRNPKEGVINKEILFKIIFVAIIMTTGTLALFNKSILSNYPIEKSRTIAFVTMALFQIFNALNSRSLKNSSLTLNPFSNIYLLFSIIFTMVLTVATVQISFFRQIFKTQILTFGEWTNIILVTISIIVLVEISKFIQKNIIKRRKNVQK